MISAVQRSRSRSPRYRRQSRSPPPPRRRRSRSPSPPRRRPSPPPRRRSSRSPSPQRRRQNRSPSPARRSRSRSRNRKAYGGGGKGTRRRSDSWDKPSQLGDRDRKRYSRSRTRSRSSSRARRSRSRTPKRNISPPPKRREEWADVKPARSPNRKGGESRRRTRSKSRGTPSPATLDDLLLSSKPLRSETKKKSSLYGRYDKHDINVISIHSKSKKLRSQSEVDDDGSAKDFVPSEVMDLFHELNTKTKSLKKKPKPIFDRDDLRKAQEEAEAVDTRVIRLLPSDKDLKKFEDQFTRRKDSPPPSSSSKKSKKKSRSPGRSGKRVSSKVSDVSTLYRTSERKRLAVTDSDLLDEPDPEEKLSSSKMDVYDNQVRKSIRDRLGGRREETDRYGREDSRNVVMDLRHSISNKSRDAPVIADIQEPVVREYGHKSVPNESKLDDQFRTDRSRGEEVEDFSKRPDKGRFEIDDPTYVPKGSRYVEHDDRDRPYRPYRGRGIGFRGWRGGSGYRGRGSRGGYGGGSSWRPRSRSPNKRDGDSDERIIIKDYRTKSADMKWKHDKFDELEDELERKAEPSSTTS